jgi:hypothetical protein
MAKKILSRISTRSVSRETRGTKKRTVSSAEPIRHYRKWHVRLTLHPVNLMIALCTGVLLVAATINSYGDSFNVSAQILAPALTAPAIIDQPLDSTTVDTETIEVSGSCPSDSYVNLYVNNTFAGVSTCTSNSFQVPATLQPGINQLNAQDYNVTNQAGPTSALISITYTEPIVTPTEPIITTPPDETAVVAPEELDDTEVPYNNVISPTVTPNPIFQGVSPPYAQITLLFHSTPRICQTTANSVGYWSCQLSSALPPGQHTVLVTATTPGGKTLSLPVFFIQVKSIQEPVVVTPVTPLYLSATYKYQVYELYQNVPVTFTINGGTAPFAWSINWGDGTVTTEVSPTDGTISFSHQYNSLHSSSGAYNIKVETIDASGKVATTQQIAILQNPAYRTVSTTKGTSHTSMWGHVVTGLHPWLWVLWPGYAIILLMIISFWLGERKQLTLNTQRLRMKHASAHHKPRQHHA